jgi:hypothetical protein
LRISRWRIAPWSGLSCACRRGPRARWCTGVCCARRGSGGSCGGGLCSLGEHPLGRLKFLLGPRLCPILCLLAYLADELFRDWRRLIAPLVTHVSENSGDLFILEHFAPWGHHIVELLAFDGHRSVEPMQDNLDHVIVPMPVLREHPLATGEWRKLTSHSQTCLLVANSAILREEALADNHRIGRRRRAASGPIPGNASRIEDIHAETSAIPKQVTRTEKGQSKEANAQPGWQQFCSFARGVRFAQQVNVLLHEILILSSFICGFVDHGFTEEVQLRAARNSASEKEDMLQAAAHLR